MKTLTQEQMIQVTDILVRISTFDGHKDAYFWLNDPKTAELFDHIRSILKEMK
jgi:hypothetical protein